MQLEQKEDLAQFKLKNAKASIGERQGRGLTWYPITITKDEVPDWILEVEGGKLEGGKVEIDTTEPGIDLEALTVPLGFF